jgi:hypothetical protein
MACAAANRICRDPSGLAGFIRANAEARGLDAITANLRSDRTLGHLGTVERREPRREPGRSSVVAVVFVWALIGCIGHIGSSVAKPALPRQTTNVTPWASGSWPE